MHTYLHTNVYVLHVPLHMKAKTMTPEGLIAFIHFSQPSMKLVDCWDHSNRGERGRRIFICPSPKGYGASRKIAAKCPYYVHLEKI